MAKKIVLTKKEKVTLMFKEHVDTFRKLKVVGPFFSPRPFYFDDKGREVCSFFTNELTKGVDIYLENYHLYGNFSSILHLTYSIFLFCNQ